MKATILASIGRIYVVYTLGCEVRCRFKRIQEVIKVGKEAESIEIEFAKNTESYSSAIEQISTMGPANVVRRFDDGRATLIYIANFMTQWVMRNRAGWFDGGTQ